MHVGNKEYLERILILDRKSEHILKRMDINEESQKIKELSKEVKKFVVTTYVTFLQCMMEQKYFLAKQTEDVSNKTPIDTLLHEIITIEISKLEDSINFIKELLIKSEFNFENELNPVVTKSIEEILDLSEKFQNNLLQEMEKEVVYYNLYGLYITNQLFELLKIDNQIRKLTITFIKEEK